ncbi:hypothetical protein [Moraxella lacunata]
MGVMFLLLNHSNSKRQTYHAFMIKATYPTPTLHLVKVNCYPYYKSKF